MRGRVGIRDVKDVAVRVALEAIEVDDDGDWPFEAVEMRQGHDLSCVAAESRDEHPLHLTWPACGSAASANAGKSENESEITRSRRVHKGTQLSPPLATALSAKRAPPTGEPVRPVSAPACCGLEPAGRPRRGRARRSQEKRRRMARQRERDCLALGQELAWGRGGGAAW